MNTQNDGVNAQLDTPKKKGPSLPIILGSTAIIGVLGVMFWANLTGDNRNSSIIPAANETPDERQLRGDLIGDVPFNAPEPDPIPEDPRIALLQAELEALRAELAGLRQPGADTPVVSGDGDATTLAALLAAQNQKFEELAAAIRESDSNLERRLRELQARRGTSGAPANETDPDAAARAAREAELEARRQAEAERLASPLLSSPQASGGSAVSASNANRTGNSFLDAAANRQVETAYASQLADTHRLVPQGTTIPAILETAISSDLPGQLRARVSRDVWSADLTTILIPKGSTLIGEYDSDVSLGQSRVLVAWNRVITTDHRSILIGSRGVDALGRAGLTGNVDHHFGLKFEAAFFVSIFTAIGNIGNAFSNDSNASLADAAGDGGDAVTDAGTSALEEYLSIPPTVNVDQGAVINVFVSRDLYL